MSRKLPPGPKTFNPAGHMFEFRRDPLGFFRQLADRYGEAAHCKIGRTDLVLLSNPDFIKEVLVNHSHNFHKGKVLKMAKRFLGEGLVTSEGDFHIRQRRLVQPAFHRQRIAGYADVMVEQAARMRDTWQDGAHLDIAQEMMRLTLGIVAKTLFDADVGTEAEAIGAALAETLQLFNRLSIPFAALLEKLPLPGNIRFNRARDRLNETIYRIIDERRKSGEDRGDLLSMLLLAQDAEDGSGMSDLQVRDEALTLFVAGYETTANAMAWIWYLLAQHPEVLAKLRAEIDQVVGDRLPTFEDLPKLAYAEKICLESLRIFPPVWSIGRTVLTDFPIGDYVLPAGTFLMMSPWVMHRDARFFKDPLRFDPDRWQPEMRSELHRFAYFPFGGGPRVCIGEQFAKTEIILLLVTLSQRWNLELLPEPQVVPLPLITLRPRFGMPMVARSFQRVPTPVLGG